MDDIAFSDSLPFLQVSGISLQEAGSSVLKEISFTQQQFQKLVIAGETGSGKSTLLQTIAGFVQPSAGQVIFENKRVKGPQEHLIPGHEGISYLSQHFELPRFLRVEQVLTYANRLPIEEAETLYEVCRISHLLKRRTDHLSGGERQRIALARLLLSSPRLLLLDEPYSNLDIVHKNILKSVIWDISDQLGITCILISHDPQDTLSWADEILVMQAGQLIQQGSPEQIYRQPVNEYAASLFGTYNLIPVARASAFFTLSGIKPNVKDILIRPEHFKIVTAESRALSGKVEKIIFYGSHYEIEVLVSDTSITLKTGTREAAVGDTVYISVLPDAVRFI